MIGLVQRVTMAKVEVDNNTVGEIKHGFLVLLGVEKEDTQDKANTLLEKILNLRVFNDENGKLNLNIQQVKGSLLVVSQFTLTADLKKGNRPGFSSGASPDLANEMYTYFSQQSAGKINTQTGMFGADMQVSLINDGPATFYIQI